MPDKELEELRRQIREKQKEVKVVETKIDIQSEKSRLRRKLFLLKHPKKVAFIKRTGRGLKATGKKVGGFLARQGKLIADQQERDRRLEVARGKRFSKKVKVRKGKRRRGSGSFDPFKLNF